MNRFTQIAASAALAVFALAGCAPEPVETPVVEQTATETPSTGITIAPSPSAPATTARMPDEIEVATLEEIAAALDTVTTLNHDTSPYLAEYDEVAMFGEEWGLDLDRNGCDTRNDVLARDMSHVEVGENNCNVRAGLLTDPYSRDQIEFKNMSKDESTVVVDRIVPLSYAIARGADKWSFTQRQEFANDPINLIAVGNDSIARKSENGPAMWLPDNEDYHCTYATKWVEVLDTYGLEIQIEDRMQLAEVLEGC